MAEVVCYHNARGWYEPPFLTPSIPYLQKHYHAQISYLNFYLEENRNTNNAYKINKFSKIPFARGWLMSDDVHFNYIYALVEAWFFSEDEAKRCIQARLFLLMVWRPFQIVEQLGRDVLEDWIEAKNFGSFGWD